MGERTCLKIPPIRFPGAYLKPRDMAFVGECKAGKKKDGKRADGNWFTSKRHKPRGKKITNPRNSGKKLRIPSGVMRQIPADLNYNPEGKICTKSEYSGKDVRQLLHAKKDEGFWSRKSRTGERGKFAGAHSCMSAMCNRDSRLLQPTEKRARERTRELNNSDDLAALKKQCGGVNQNERPQGTTAKRDRTTEGREN